MRTPALKLLLGAYFHQDWFDEFADEDEAVDAFVQGEPHLREQLQAEIDDLLGSMDEARLAGYLSSIGCEYLPGEDVRYRGWLRQIADHLSAATAG